jgi:hypothetical protein
VLIAVAAVVEQVLPAALETERLEPVGTEVVEPLHLFLDQQQPTQVVVVAVATLPLEELVGLVVLEGVVLVLALLAVPELPQRLILVAEVEAVLQVAAQAAQAAPALSF